MLRDSVVDGGGRLDLDDSAGGAVGGGGGGGAGGFSVDGGERDGGRKVVFDDVSGGGCAGNEGGVGALVASREGATVDGFLDVMGGGGGCLDEFDGTGGARSGVTSAVDCAREGTPGVGRCPGLGGALRRFATKGLAGCGGEDSDVSRPGLRAFNRGAVGGFGAAEAGAFTSIFRNVSRSER